MLTSSQLTVTVVLPRRDRFVWDNILVEQVIWRVNQPISRVANVKGEGFYDGQPASGRMPLDRVPGRVRRAIAAELERATATALARV